MFVIQENQKNSFINGINYISNMKNFQDWLDFQLYSSHLKNLTKIKQQSLQLKNTNLPRKFLKTANQHRRNMTWVEISDNRSKNSLYTMKVQRKQNQINQQNLNLASRLINVSSVISKDKQLQSYRKYQSIFKKTSCTGNKKIELCKSRKLKKFMKIHEDNYIIGLHRTMIKIRFISIPKIPSGQQPTIWVELYSGIEKVSSSHFALHEFLINEIKFPLKQKINRNIMMKIHCSRGLSYISLGEYYLQSPREGTCTEFCDIVSVQDPRKIVTVNVEVENIGRRHHSSLHAR